MMYEVYGCMLYVCCMVAIQRDSVTLIYGASYSKYNSFSYSASYSTAAGCAPITRQV